MKSYLKNAVNKVHGFTLVELLVVISIIGILSGVMLVGLNTSKAKSRDTKRVADVNNLALALELYFNKHRFYPEGADATALGLLVDDGEGNSFMSKLPKDPKNLDYKYIGLNRKGTSAAIACNVSNPCNYYHLGTTLEVGGSVLDDDQDYDSSSMSGFNGDADATNKVYDIVPSF